MPEFTKLQELVYDVKIEDVMTREVVTVTPEITMTEFREVLRARRISGTPVLDQGQLVGIVSIEDLIKCAVSGEMEDRIGEKMTHHPMTVRANESVVLAVNYFNRHGFGRFPVVDKEGNLVGILTRGDIIRGLLKQLDLEYHQEEVLRHRVSHIFDELVSDLTSISLHYYVLARNFDKAGQASSKIKRALNRLGFSPQIVRRVAIATYELEMNLVIHTTNGGDIIGEVQPEKIIIRAMDTGPGIPDIEQALRPGFSTAEEWIREMGFGAGMGLVNVRKCADEMLVESPNQMWTSVKVVIYLDEERQCSTS